jgi:hypothetical protein
VALRGDLDQALGRERDLAAQLAVCQELKQRVEHELTERLGLAQRAIEAQLADLAQVHRELGAAQGAAGVEGATVRLPGGRTVELVPLVPRAEAG